MRSGSDIVAELARRKTELGPLHARAADVTDTYNGDLVIALPELDKNERRAVPNLLNQGLNQMAMRISSTVPDAYCPPERPGFKESESFARIRRQAILGWWEFSDMRMLMGRRARHLIGYAMSPVVIRYDFKLNVPRWELRHPLHTYPSATLNPDDVHPDDCIFTFSRTLKWLMQNYPSASMILNKGARPRPDDKFELVEYMDDDEIVLLVIGSKETSYNAGAANQRFVELERIPNRAGICPAVVPGRITLDRAQGAYDGMIGLYQRQAKLMALEVIAVERGIFPNEWLVARPNENPVVVLEADGINGTTGIVRGGTLESHTENPSYRTDQTISAMERAQRLEAGIPAEFGGESTTNVRTGRRGDAILSAVVDYPVQEAQRTFETSMSWENRVAIAQVKGYSGSMSRSFYVNWKGAKGVVQYIPDKHFTTDANTVSYSHAGADVNSLIIGIGQMIGVGLISKALGREMNPMIDDPDREHRRTILETLETAQLGSLANAATSGTMSPADLARIEQIVSESAESNLSDAIIAVQKEAQARQASSGPPGTPTGPVAPGAPEAQPGIAPAGAGAEAGTIGPSQNEQGLASLMTALGHGAPNRAVA